MPKLFVPHVFRAGDTVDPRQVNENALAVHSHFLRMMEDRYNYFSVLLPFGLLANGENAKEFEVPVRIPFAADIVSAEMSLYSMADGSGSDTDVSVTCSLDGWNTLTATLDESDTTTRQSAFSAQSVTIPADTEVTFTLSDPGANNSALAYVVLHCRYDCISGYEAEESVTIAPPTLPQVRDDEVYAVSEWETWHTAMDAQIGYLVEALKRRKRFEILTMGKDLGTSVGPTTARGHFGLPGRATDYCEEFRVYNLSDATFTLTMSLYDKGQSRFVAEDVGASSGGSSAWVSAAKVAGTDMDNPDVSGDVPGDVGLELQITTGGSGNNYRSHAIISWREVA